MPPGKVYASNNLEIRRFGRLYGAKPVFYSVQHVVKVFASVIYTAKSQCAPPKSSKLLASFQLNKNCLATDFSNQHVTSTTGD